jgi:aminomethyltransferase
MSLSNSSRQQRTPLFPLYARCGARVVDFHGWDLPVQFAGVMREHRAVRTDAGLFDVSHMGEIEISGPGALEFIQRLCVNDASRLADGQVQYSAMCFDDGGIVDDVTVYRFAADRFLFCVNASNRGKDLGWIRKHRPEGVEVRDLSDETALLALQGPKAEFILNRLVDLSLPGLKYYHFSRCRAGGNEVVVSRTGYTGEDGFEIFLPPEAAAELWQKIMAAGEPAGLMPAGLGARDTLRLEMKYALYGNDIDETTDPLEAGLGWITKLDKGEFFGRGAIIERSGEGPARKLVGIEVKGRGIARAGHAIWADGSEVGTVTSGTLSPTLRKAIALGYVPTPLSRPGTAVSVEIRAAKVEAEVVRTPFYRNGSIRK